MEAEDGWEGTPLQITVNSDARPSLQGADVEKVGDKSYVLPLRPTARNLLHRG